MMARLWAGLIASDNFPVFQPLESRIFFVEFFFSLRKRIREKKWKN